jgi:hypothetical protein
VRKGVVVLMGTLAAHLEQGDSEVGAGGGFRGVAGVAGVC